jgi:hypothetical protein
VVIDEMVEEMIKLAEEQPALEAPRKTRPVDQQAAQ